MFGVSLQRIACGKRRDCGRGVLQLDLDNSNRMIRNAIGGVRALCGTPADVACLDVDFAGLAFRRRIDHLAGVDVD
jgi:hypothetical protein